MTSPATAEGAAAGAGGQGTGTQGGGVQPGGGSSAPGQGGGTRGGQPQGTGTGGQPAGGKGGENGLYDEYLQGIPAQLHPTVTEAFKKWDANVTQRQQEVRSQYAPYQSLIDSGADPQQLQVAQQFVDWLQEDPAEALRQMVETFELDPQQLFGPGGQQQQAQPAGQGGVPDEGQGAGPGDPQGADPPPSWFTQFQEQTVKPLEDLVQLMAQERVAQHQGRQQEQEIDQLEQVLGTALQGVGSSLEDQQAVSYVLGQLAISDDGAPLQQAVDEAVKQWQELRQSIGGQTASAQVPRVLPGGGGLPTQQVDPASLTQKDRRALAVQRAKELMAQGSG